jgi:GTPase involved in cell partitioning and DNA repair
MANQANNEDYEVINLNHLNKDGLLAHIFNMCLEEKDKGIIRFCNNTTQADKLRLICIYLNRMKNQLVHQVKTLQTNWMDSLEAFKNDLEILADEREYEKCHEEQIEKMENKIDSMYETLKGDIIPNVEEEEEECRTCRKPVKLSDVWHDVSEFNGSLKIECDECYMKR